MSTYAERQNTLEQAEQINSYWKKTIPLLQKAMLPSTNTSKTALLAGFDEYFTRIQQSVGMIQLMPYILFGIANGYNYYLPQSLPMGKDIMIQSILAHVVSTMSCDTPAKTISYATTILQSHIERSQAALVARKYLKHDSKVRPYIKITKNNMMDRLALLPAETLMYLANKSWRGDSLTPVKPVQIDIDDLKDGKPIFIPLGYDLSNEKAIYSNSLLPQTEQTPTFVLKNLDSAFVL
jgi:hypothetical protein